MYYCTVHYKQYSLLTITQSTVYRYTYIFVKENSVGGFRCMYVTDDANQRIYISDRTIEK